MTKLAEGKATIVLSKGDPEIGDYSERTITGVIRRFKQDGEDRWEISTGVEQHPAVGFRPENVVSIS